MEKRQCNMCKKFKKTVTEHISRSQLIFGGFRGSQFELRCQACETKLCKEFEKTIDKYQSA